MSEYLCYCDMEFICGYNIPKEEIEVLSIGLIICDTDHNFVREFYATTRPIVRRKLQKKCKQLTKLTQAEIDDSFDSEAIMSKVVRLLHRYSIKNVFVYGNCDQESLLSDAMMHRRNNRAYQNIALVSSMIVDIQPAVTKELGLIHAVNMKDLSNALGWFPDTGQHYHNALIDARALYHVCKAAYTMNVNAIPTFVQLRLDQERKEKLREEEKRKQLLQLRQKAFAIPETAEEHSLLETLPPVRQEQYLRLRVKILTAFSKFPDETMFSMIVYFNHGIRVKPKCAIHENPSVYLYYREFSRSNFRDFLVKYAVTIQDKAKKK